MVLSDEWTSAMAGNATRMSGDADTMAVAGMGEVGTQTFGARGNLRETFGNAYEIAGMLENMGVINQDTVDLIHKITAIVVLGTSFYMLYAGVRTLVTSLIALNTAAAAAETGAKAATGPPGWIVIGIAAAAMAAVAGAFAVGYAIGDDDGGNSDTNVSYSNTNINTPGGMSRAEAGMREVAASG